MKTTGSNHLTANEKRAIKEMIKLSLSEAKVNRKNYKLTTENEMSVVYITENSTQWCELKPRVTTRRVEFKN